MAKESAKQTRLDGINELRTFLAGCHDVIREGGHPDQDAVEKFVDQLLDAYNEYQGVGDTDG